MSIRRGDAFDADEMRRLVAQSSSYRRIRERIEATRAAALKDLVTATTWEQAARLQSAILTLDMVLSLPGILLREIEGSGERRGS